MRQGITSRGNEKIKRLRQLAKDGAFRRAEGEFLAEGPLLLAEALAAGAPVTAVFAAEGKENAVLPANLPPNLPVYLLPEALLESIAPTQATQGLLFTCRMEEKEMAPHGRTLLLDGLADPGNLGTIFRTADAFAFDGVLLTAGTADPYSPKAVRSTMGAIFRLPFAKVGEGELAAVLKRLGVPLYAAVLEESRPPSAFLPGPCCLAVGNEARGVSKAVLELASGHIRIPMPGRAESLNAAVAAGILCYLAAEQR